MLIVQNKARKHNNPFTGFLDITKKHAKITSSELKLLIFRLA